MCSQILTFWEKTKTKIVKEKLPTRRSLRSGGKTISIKYALENNQLESKLLETE